MSSACPEIYAVRHGQTEWSLSGRHTGRTDIPLTAAGEEAARGIAGRLPAINFAAVWSSPSQRARNTCALAGFGDRCVVKDDLAEWDYGAYEGITTKAILAGRPDWRLFRDGCPDGLKARVSYVSPDPEFTPPVIYSLQNRQKLVYLVEAHPEGNATGLQPGQIVDVDLAGR